MGTRETIVEHRLHKEFKKLGGTTRKWVSPGRVGVMDRICFLPGDKLDMEASLALWLFKHKPETPDEAFELLYRQHHELLKRSRVSFVEVKTVDGKLSVRQQREADELSSFGAEVHVVYGVTGVDELVDTFKC